MIEEQALVVATTEPCADGLALATLEIERKTACGLCGQTRGCGNQAWGKLLGHTHNTFKALNTIQASAGQSVIVAIDEQVMLKGALLLYALPLVSMFLLAIIAQTIWAKELVVMLGALLGLLLGWLWVKSYLTAHPYVFGKQASIIRLAEQQSDPL